MKIDSIWKSLEKEDNSESWLVYKRYSGSVLPDIYISVTYPEKLRSIAVHLSSEIELNLTAWDKFRDIRIYSRFDERNKEKGSLFC